MFLVDVPRSSRWNVHYTVRHSLVRIQPLCAGETAQFLRLQLGALGRRL